jgi:hypothetical protein
MLPERLRYRRGADANPTGNGRRLSIAVLIILLLIVVASNVLVLVDDGAHNLEYAVLRSATSLFVSHPYPNSPSEVRRRALQTTAAQAAAEARARQASIDILIASSLTLAQATTRLVAEHNALRAAHSTMQSTSGAIARRIAARTAAGASRNVGTLMGKVVPYAGAASVLAITAWDLADACQSLKDLNDLAIASGNAKGTEEATVCGMRMPSVDEVRTWSAGMWK